MREVNVSSPFDDSNLHTFHLAAVHGRWAWLLSPSRYRLYRDGCGSPLVI